MKRAFALALAVAATGILATTGSATPRSGALQVTKECSHYTATAGSYCTITSSNLNTIKPGSRVVYASGANFFTPGNNNAYGHVLLSLVSFTGTVWFTGGTGEFSHFRAGPIAVACPLYPVCSWDGPYSFRAG